MRHRIHERSPESGTSLIETLIATLILAMVSLSILGLFSKAAHLNATGSTYTAMNNVAKDQLEFLMALPFTDASLAVGTTTLTIADPPLEVETVITNHLINASVTTVQTSIDTVDTTGGANVKVIAVSVAATSAVGFGQRHVSVVAIKVAQ